MRQAVYINFEDDIINNGEERWLPDTVFLPTRLVPEFIPIYVIYDADHLHIPSYISNDVIHIVLKGYPKIHELLDGAEVLLEYGMDAEAKYDRTGIYN